MFEIFKSKTVECINAGKFKEALFAAANWASLDDSADASYSLGLCHHALGQPHKSVGFLESALRKDKAHRNSAALLALCHFRQRNIAEARQWLDRVHQLDGPLADPGLPGVAEMSVNFKDFHRARDYAEQLVQLRPQKPDYWVHLANIHHYLHETDEADRACRKALALSPHHALACYALSQFRRATPENHHLDLFQSAFNRNASDPQTRFLIGAALGKEYEDLGKYDEAFHWLDLAMAAKFGQLDPRQIESERKLTRDVASAFAGIDRPAVTGFPSDRPIFIVGMPRSGTTLLEQILGTTEDIHVAGELDDFDIALWEQLDPQRTATSLNSAYLENAAKIDFERLGRDYIESVKPQVGDCRHFIDKKPHNFLNAGYIALALPHARIISLRRGAMDTCFANFKQAFAGTPHLYSYRQEDTASYYLAYRELMEFWEEQIPGRIFEVNYEDLVRDPESTSKRVFAHLGLKWSPACLSFHENPRVSGSASSEQVRRPVYDSSVGHWRNFQIHLRTMCQGLEGGDPE